MAKDGSGITLYWGSGSPPCWKVMFVMEEKGLLKNCTSKLLQFSKKEHKSEEVLKLNPRGQMPTFKDNGVVVNESMAICFYLEDTYGDQGTRLLPKDPIKRSQVCQRIFEQSNIDTAFRAVFMYKMSKDEKDEAKEKELYGKLEEEMAVWDGYLNGKEYLCFDEFSMADIFLYIFTAMLVRQGGKLDKYPNLKKFNELVAKRDAASASAPPHWKNDPSPNILMGFGV